MKGTDVLVLAVLTTVLMVAWSTAVLSIPWGTMDILDPGSLRGQRLHNLQGDDLGRIEDVTAAPDGQPELIILSVMGKKLVAIPFSALLPASRKDRFVVNVTEDQLRNTPGLSLNQRQNLISFG